MLLIGVTGTEYRLRASDNPLLTSGSVALNGYVDFQTESGKYYLLETNTTSMVSIVLYIYVIIASFVFPRVEFYFLFQDADTRAFLRNLNVNIQSNITIYMYMCI